MSTITMDKEEAICLNEHRSVVTTVECEDDIFFDMGSLICELDDICLYGHALSPVQYAPAKEPDPF